VNVTVEFHFDLASPNAYLSHKVIPAIEQRTDANSCYVPVLLFHHVRGAKEDGR
jgi:2-hydroxychromene-2-carboxylate isomerase